MEDTFKTKIDQDFKAKTDAASDAMDTMVARITSEGDHLKNIINQQMTVLDVRQATLVEENTRLHQDMYCLKLEVKQIIDSVAKAHEGDTVPHISPLIEVRNQGGIKPDPILYGDGAVHDKNTNFLHDHLIDTQGGRNPILTPFHFHYPLGNHHVKEVESYKFQKAKLSVKCEGEDYVFTFYNTLCHVAASFNILLQPLEKITKTTGICLLTANNCVGYEQAKDIMSTAIHLKLTWNDYFNNFPKAQTYI